MVIFVEAPLPAALFFLDPFAIGLIEKDNDAEDYPAEQNCKSCSIFPTLASIFEI